MGRDYNFYRGKKQDEFLRTDYIRPCKNKMCDNYTIDKDNDYCHNCMKLFHANGNRKDISKQSYINDFIEGK